VGENGTVESRDEVVCTWLAMGGLEGEIMHDSRGGKRVIFGVEVVVVGVSIAE
jgi:hypothetical protein